MKNYKTQSYKYLIGLFIILMPFILIITFFLWVQIYTALGYGKGGLFNIILFIPMELIFLRIMYPVIITFGSCLFNITFHKEKFEFRTIFRNKTFYYTEVDSLTEISPVIGYMQNKEAKIRIIEIKLKNKKTMHILIDSLNYEGQDDLRKDLQKYMRMSLDLSYRFILSIK